MKLYGNRRRLLLEIFHPDIGLNDKIIYLDDYNNYRCSDSARPKAPHGGHKKYKMLLK